MNEDDEKLIIRSEEIMIKTRSRCKETLYIMHHKCVKVNPLGFVCKYCMKPLIKIRQEEQKK